MVSSWATLMICFLPVTLKPWAASHAWGRSLDAEDFVWCGKRIYRDKETREVHLNVLTYHQQLKPITVPQGGRSNLEAHLVR